MKPNVFHTPEDYTVPLRLVSYRFYNTLPPLISIKGVPILVEVIGTFNNHFRKGGEDKGE